MSVPGPSVHPASFLGSVGFVVRIAREILVHLPRLVRLRRRLLRVPKPEIPRVVLIGDNMDNVHGISVSSIRLVEGFRARGREAWVVGVSHSARKPGARNPGGSVQMLPASVIQELFGYTGAELAFPDLDAFLDFWEEARPDIVEVETPGTFGLFAMLAGSWLGADVVHNYRTDLLSYTRLLLANPLFVGLLHWYLRSFYRSGGHVVVPSRAFLEEAHYMGVALANIRLLPRGVDLRRFRPELADPEVWQRRGAPKGPVVMYLGRVSTEKGLRTLAEAYPRILEEVPDAVIGIVGDGPFLTELRELLGHHPQAVFCGEVVGDELPPLLAAASVLAFPSTTDTFGNAVLEALASGVPAVVTDRGGPCEIVQDGRSGLVVPGDDPDALAEAVTRLLLHPRVRARMSVEARKRAAEFSPEVSQERHWDFYTQIHARRPCAE